MLKSRWWALIFLLAVLITVPAWGMDYVLLFCLFFCLYLSLAQMWNLLVGFSGLLSLGQQAFIGLSGYTVAVLTGYYDINIWLGVLLGGLFSVILALVMSLFIFRLKGIYFAIGTWIFAEMLLIWFGNWKYVKYGGGLFVKADPLPSITVIYYVALFLAVAGFCVIHAIVNSKIGLGLMAMRDDEEAAEAVGVKIFRTKLVCFLIAAFMTGLSAGVFYTFQIFVEPFKAFAIDWTVTFLFIVVIGGIGMIEGPIVGAFIYVLLSQYLGEYGSVSLLLMGIMAIMIILLAPEGVMGTLREKAGFMLMSPRKR